MSEGLNQNYDKEINMSEVTIYRDLPIIAEKIRPNGTLNGLDGRIDIASFLMSEVASTAEMIYLSTGSHSKGSRKLGHQAFVRVPWQTAF